MVLADFSIESYDRSAGARLRGFGTVDSYPPAVW